MKLLPVVEAIVSLCELLIKPMRRGASFSRVVVNGKAIVLCGFDQGSEELLNKFLSDTRLTYAVSWPWTQTVQGIAQLVDKHLMAIGFEFSFYSDNILGRHILGLLVRPERLPNSQWLIPLPSLTIGPWCVVASIANGMNFTPLETCKHHHFMALTKRRTVSEHRDISSEILNTEFLPSLSLLSAKSQS